MNFQNNHKLTKREKLIKSAVNASLFVAHLVVFIKIYVYYYTQSLSLLSGLLESFLDISTSVINYFAIFYATIPADENHRFGHNKIEDLATFAQAFFFLSTGIFGICSIVYKVYAGYVTTETNFGIEAIFLIILINLSLIIYQKYVVYKTKSGLIKADYLHYLTDFFTHLGMIISLYFYNYQIIDQIIGIFIGLYIIYSAINLAKMSLAGLLDEELDTQDINKIIELLKSINEVLGLHDLRTRKAGGKKFIQFHLELDANLSLYESNQISHKVSDKIAALFEEEIDILIHQDPFIHNKKHKFKVF